MAGNEGMVYVPGGTYEGEQIRALYVDQHEFANEDYAEVAAVTAGEFQLARVNDYGDTVEIIETGKNPKALWRKYAKAAQRLDHDVRYFLKPTSDFPPLRTISLVRVRGERFNHPRQPMVLVSGEEAKKICEAQGKRLPTPLEWGYVASKGGTKEYSTDDGTLNEGVHRNAEVTRVVCKASGHYVKWNGKEVCDMNGNAWEWTYGQGWAIDPEFEGFFKCGGSWFQKQAMPTSCSDLHEPDYYGFNTGFRCVADVPEESPK